MNLLAEILYKIVPLYYMSFGKHLIISWVSALTILNRYQVFIYNFDGPSLVATVAGMSWISIFKNDGPIVSSMSTEILVV